MRAAAAQVVDAVVTSGKSLDAALSGHEPGVPMDDRALRVPLWKRMLHGMGIYFALLLLLVASPAISDIATDIAGSVPLGAAATVRMTSPSRRRISTSGRCRPGSRLTRYDSSGLSEMVTFYRRLRDAGGAVRIVDREGLTLVVAAT